MLVVPHESKVLAQAFLQPSSSDQPVKESKKNKES